MNVETKLPRGFWFRLVFGNIDKLVVLPFEMPTIALQRPYILLEKQKGAVNKWYEQQREEHPFLLQKQLVGTLHIFFEEFGLPYNVDT